MNERSSTTLARWALVIVLVIGSILRSHGADQIAERGKIAFKQADVVVFCGGEDMVALQENPYLEMLLTLNFPEKRVHFRNLGWEGDTVYEQRRDLNFGSWSDQLQRARASFLFIQFGQSESLQGGPMLPQFFQAYEKLFNEFAGQTERIVLLSPTPFERSQPLLPDLALRNDDLQVYVEAIRKLAQKCGFLFVDLFTPLRKSSLHEVRLTRDGLHLNFSGHWLAAQETIKQLGLKEPESRISLDPATGLLSPPLFEELRQTMLQKNRFWFDYWRPMNWAFLHGDRIEQPSSRDHRNPKIRWFPAEMEKFLPLIEQKEQKIAELAQAAAAKPNLR